MLRGVNSIFLFFYSDLPEFMRSPQIFRMNPYSYIRKEGNKLILADLKGLGVINRIWTPIPTPIGSVN